MNVKKFTALLTAWLLTVTMLLSGCGGGAKDENNYPAPGTKGFTLEELETALNKFARSSDTSYLNQFTLDKSDEILAYMESKENTANSSDYDEDTIKHYGVHDFMSLKEIYMNEAEPSFESIQCSFDNDLSEISEYFAEYSEKNLFDTAKDAVKKAYPNGEITFESLSFCDILLMETVEYGIYFDIFVIETNNGYFLLLDIQDID